MTVKKRLFGVMVFLSITVLVFVSGVLAVAAAQNNEDKRTFAERVATILGIESQKVQDAMDQAKADIAAERREAFADDLIENGVMTEEEAEELFDNWTAGSKFYGPFKWSEKWGGEGYSFDKKPFGHFRFDKEMDPDDGDGVERKHRFSFVVPSRGEFHHNFGEGDIFDWLDDLVEDGVMSQEDADAIRGILEDGFPSSIEGIMPGLHDDERKFEFDSDDGHFRFRGRWKWDGWEDDDSSDSDDKGAENDDIFFAAQF